ncbi:MAG: DUF421 domain-containing protein [Armatimonadota bacterium]
MTLAAIAARVIFSYLFLLLIVRVSGKRTVRQVTPIDFTASIIAGDLIDDLLWAEVPASQAVVAVGTLLSLAILITMGTQVSPTLERWVSGRPEVMIRGGEWVKGSLRRERLEKSELLGLVREQGIDDLREIETATLETTGQLGICPRPWAREAQKCDLVRVRQRGEAEA